MKWAAIVTVQKYGRLHGYVTASLDYDACVQCGKRLYDDGCYTAHASGDDDGISPIAIFLFCRPQCRKQFIDQYPAHEIALMADGVRWHVEKIIAKYPSGYETPMADDNLLRIPGVKYPHDKTLS